MNLFNLRPETNIQLKIPVMHYILLVVVKIWNEFPYRKGENISLVTSTCSGGEGYILCLSCNSLGYSKSTSSIYQSLLSSGTFKISIKLGAHLKHLRGSLCDIAQEYSELAS